MPFRDFCSSNQPWFPLACPQNFNPEKPIIFFTGGIPLIGLRGLFNPPKNKLSQNCIQNVGFFVFHVGVIYLKETLWGQMALWLSERNPTHFEGHHHIWTHAFWASPKNGLQVSFRVFYNHHKQGLPTSKPKHVCVCQWVCLFEGTLLGFNRNEEETTILARFPHFRTHQCMGDPSMLCSTHPSKYPLLFQGIMSAHLVFQTKQRAKEALLA